MDHKVRFPRKFLCLFLICSPWIAAAETAATTGTAQHANDDEPAEPSFGPQCGVYYAPSTIPGAGYGIFAGKDFREHEWVLPGDLVVPIVEMAWNNGYARDYHHLWEDYQWSSRSFDGMDREGESASGASFGVGALPNCFHPFINLEETYTIMDWAGLHRRTDPGAGAFTPYHDRKTYAYDDIPAGMELFVDYGASYFPSRENLFGPIPGIEDYRFGDALLNNLEHTLDFVMEELESDAKLEESGECSEERVCVSDRDTWRFAVESDFLATCREIGVIWGSRPLLTLPENATHVDYLMEHGTRYMHYNRSLRSIEWLEANGLCTDNIKPGNSTLKQAGRGAFATRRIPKGGLVAPAPLIHIPNRSIYNMYESIVDDRWHEHTLVRNESAIVGHQLILNYCFGHRQSTLLLCPYGIGVGLINHEKEKVNTKIIWSTKGTRHPEWLEKKIDEWGASDHAGLAFDLIALRDIDENEEIFIDYGDEWEMAWQEHVRNWKPPPGSNDYQPSSILNEMDEAIIRTMAEGSYNPETDKHLYCREIFREYAGAEDESDFDFQACRALDRYVDSDGEYRYIVETYTEVQGPYECHEENNFIIFDLPRDGFNFRDALYSLDHSQKWAFRHDIRIPDEIMPESWKNAPGIFQNFNRPNM